MVDICTKLADMPKILALAARYEEVFCSVGVHPHEAAAQDGLTATQLDKYARLPEIAGIGETGLDYHYNNSPAEAQKRSLDIHIEAARAHDLPLIIHARNADDDMAAILRREAAKGGLRGVMHCFTSGLALADAALEAGFYISISGIITFRNAKEVRAAARHTPADRLLVETDAPFLAPEPHRGKRNEPAFVRHTAAHLASVRGEDEAALEEQTTRNFLALFNRVRL